MDETHLNPCLLTHLTLIWALKGPHLGSPDGPNTIGPNTIGPIGPHLAINMHFGALTSDH